MPIQWNTTIEGHTGDLIDIKSFMESCESNFFMDYDGMGHMVKDGKIIDPKWIWPSTRHTIPEDVTHILWYNR